MRRDEVATTAVRRWVETGQMAYASTGGWTAEVIPSLSRPDEARVRFQHFGTTMAAFQVDKLGGYVPETLSTYLGWGSVSDAAGMNGLFKAFNMAYRYHRDAKGGGPRIEATDETFGRVA